jgi:transposase
MASTTDPNAPQTWVAIDVAKGVNVALIERPGGEQHRLRFVHCREDYDRLVDLLRQLPAPCRIALEPTADYHRTLAFCLVSRGFDVVFVSSVAGARLREAAYNSWDKNDPKDAQVILRLLKLGMTQRYCDPLVAQTHDLQELSKTYHHIARARTRLQHVLVTHYLPLYFPEFERFWSTQRNEWFIRFLLRFPTPASVKALDFATFREAVSALMGRRVHKSAKIAEIYALAEHSIGLPVSDSSLAVTTFRLQLERYLQLCEARQQLEVDAEHLLHDRPDYQQLRSVPGIGPIIALVILAEAGDLRRFDHHRQFLKFCGLDLAKTQSGSFRSRERLSKRGNARLRYALWQAAMSAVRMRENPFRDKFRRYVAAAPDDADLKRKARTAVTAKMARVVHALVKSNCVYQPRFELGFPSGSTPLRRAVEASGTS